MGRIIYDPNRGPRVGDTRDCGRFVFCKTIGYETRYLERARWRETYDTVFNDGMPMDRWVATEWLDENGKSLRDIYGDEP